MPEPRKVLVVEDDAATLEFMLLALAEAGYEARGGKARPALALLERWTPDVVVTDLRMPYRDGTEVAAWVKARWPTMRVVLYSAQPNTAVFRTVKAYLPIDAFVSKPFDIADMIAAIEGT